MKKGILIMMSLALVFVLSLGLTDSADARRGGGFKSPKQSYTQTPKKTDNVQQSSSGTKSSTGSTTGAAKSGGLFGGGGFMKGLLFGGLAGMMFGGMFGGMGAFGEILTLAVNIIIIMAIIMVIRAAFVYIRSKKPNPDQRRPY